MITENTYFEGGVKSLAFVQSEQQVSVGVMAVGEYTFGTNAPEKMTVVKGDLTIRLKGEENWETYASGESFNVPGHSHFDVKVEQMTAYLCEYL
ncbi:pyrimidine/purine nucleoside phosphorylase [Vibrio sp. S9_S30]|uniref:pyrimidine/purine nucleoside phosphorylase n=1 Tax=Vibrio sp. S9_S30 TaxID=2720226 RepID=UPI00167FF8C6|nr:pyrimidine/purine nucleoside phosphorylase [Vibrio sp. S9_S30]MBD1557084.1 pyrimidine/purine nucleoside phosphorylase [Vibrio sp. S9_S30]